MSAPKRTIVVRVSPAMARRIRVYRFEPGSDCSICMRRMMPDDQAEEDDEKTTTLACLHTFHAKCARRWKRGKQCALCRGGPAE